MTERLSIKVVNRVLAQCECADATVLIGAQAAAFWAQAAQGIFSWRC